MRFLRQFEWTIRVCSILFKDAASFPLQSFLPPLLTVTTYLALQGLRVDVPIAFVTSYVLGYALSLWIRMPWLARQHIERKWSVWWIILFPVSLMTLVMFFQSSSIALRIAYLSSAVRLSAFLLDLMDGTADAVRRLYPQHKVLRYERTLTRVLFLRDIAMILLAETVIVLGSVPQMLAVLAFWQMLNAFIEHIVVVSVILVCEDEERR
jgi:hypothetical protein